MKRFIKKLVFLLTVAMFFATCSKMLEVSDRNAVEAENHYNNFNDADNAILGIYGKLMGLAERVVILNELRADLMDVTANSTADMVSLNNHTATAGNKYCDLAPFYEIILNCNDAIANFDRMLAENKMSRAEYSYRYSDVVTARCWVYLQLAVHFGNIPYVTQPLVTVSDLNDASRFPIMGFNQILQELINDMEAAPFMELSNASPLWVTADGQLLRMFFLNKKIMLGDLYLWANRYEDAAAQYISMIEEAETKLFSGNRHFGYKVDGWVWNESNEPRFQICYFRYRTGDLDSYRNRWKEMFARPSTNSELSYEMITMWSYDARFAPQYPLIELFANTGKGKYMLRPSEWAIHGLWETQVQRENQFVFDGRGRQSSFDWVNEQPVVLKYLYDYFPHSVDANRTIHLQYHANENEHIQRGKWFVYRAGLLHLRYAEAANRAGYPTLAYAILNNGLRNHYSWRQSDGSAWIRQDEVMVTSFKPVSDDIAPIPYPHPFFLDARETGAQYGNLRAPWHRHYGIRRRAWVEDIEKPEWVLNKADSIQWIENALLTEAALECGFEGHRWGDLLRIAQRRNAEDGSGTYLLNDIVGNKFEQEGKPAPNITPNNWFLPWK